MALFQNGQGYMLNRWKVDVAPSSRESARMIYINLMTGEKVEDSSRFEAYCCLLMKD
jgi:hypothetical protein